MDLGPLVLYAATIGIPKPSWLGRFGLLLLDSLPPLFNCKTAIKYLDLDFFLEQALQFFGPIVTDGPFNCHV